MKPGIRTTELWLTIATNIGLLASALAGSLSPKWAAVATAIATSAYAVARGIAKTGAATVVVPAAPAAPPRQA